MKNLREAVRYRNARCFVTALRSHVVSPIHNDHAATKAPATLPNRRFFNEATYQPSVRVRSGADWTAFPYSLAAHEASSCMRSADGDPGSAV